MAYFGVFVVVVVFVFFNLHLAFLCLFVCLLVWFPVWAESDDNA